MVAESIVSYKLLAISEKCFNTTMTRKGFDDDTCFALHVHQTA